MEWLVFGVLLIGVLLLWAEFYLPGGILGVLGGAMIFIGLILGYIEFGLLWGSIITIGVIVLVIFLLRHWMRTFHLSFFGKRMMLDTEIGGKEVYDTLSGLVGKSGETATRLQPSGKAVIEGKKFDVVAERGSIDAGVGVKVVKVDGIEVVVRPNSV